jgi:hypothetical protein
VSLDEALESGDAAQMAKLLKRIEKLCDQPMNPGTPWWIFRDAVRDILKDGE